jgi:hypothetical protein
VAHATPPIALLTRFNDVLIDGNAAHGDAPVGRPRDLRKNNTTERLPKMAVRLAAPQVRLGHS